MDEDIKETGMQKRGLLDALLSLGGSSEMKPSEPTCLPHDNIMFLKTQRCASSTLQNILYRWGDNRNLSFALPKTTWPYMGSPALFHKLYAIEPADGVYNILANHARFSEKGMAKAMPNNSIYISILRNPVTQYESLYEYDELFKRFSVSLSSFIQTPLVYFQREPIRTNVAGRNSMMYDLGLDARSLEANDDSVSEWINMLEKKFSLVLITDHLSESLILLKDILCWTIDDVVHLKQNARVSKNRTLSSKVQDGIRSWNSVDSRLYEHFNKTLWRKVAEYGVERMKRDVAELERKNQLASDDCVKGVLKSGDKRVYYPKGLKIESFQVNPNATDSVLCSRMTRPENEYLKYLQEKQRRRNAAILGIPYVAAVAEERSKKSKRVNWAERVHDQYKLNRTKSRLEPRKRRDKLNRHRYDRRKQPRVV